MKYGRLYLPLLVCLVLSCEDDEPLVTHIPGFEIGEHIEGLRVGLSPMDVLPSLNAPSDTFRTALGLDAYLIYADSMHVGLRKNQPQDGNYILRAVRVFGDYQGSSPQGLRLGSTRQQIQEFFGTPQIQEVFNDRHTDYYEFSESNFRLTYIQEELLIIEMELP